MEQADLSDMLGDKEYKPMPQWIQNLFTAVMYLVMVAVGTRFCGRFTRA